jgi:hypothetical protein
MKEYKNEDVFLETVVSGNLLKVTAIHNGSGIEAFAVGPTNSQDYLNKIALKKLEIELKKNAVDS